MNTLVSDGEKCITHTAVRQFLIENNINFHVSTAGIKTGNSDVERFHGTLNEHLRILRVDGDEDELDAQIFKVVLIYNDTIHSTTKLKPNDFLSKNLTKTDIEEMVKMFSSEKQKRMGKINKNRDPDLHLTDNIVVNRTQVKNDPKYRLLRTFDKEGDYLTNRGRPGFGTKYYTSQIKRNYKYQT